MAVDKAVKEVIPAVDASVHIACFSSGQMAWHRAMRKA